MTNFRKRNSQIPILGIRTSPQTGQTITSSGNPSLDLLLGGGLPIGSICLIEEDKYVTHSRVLAKYFISEGICSDHSIFLASLDDDLPKMVRDAPAPIVPNYDGEEEEVPVESPSKNGIALRIAWRYNDLPLINSEQTTKKIGHNFNLLEKFKPYELQYKDINLWDNTSKFTLTAEDIKGEKSDQDEEEDEISGAKEQKNSSNSSTASTNSTFIISKGDTDDTDKENFFNSSELSFELRRIKFPSSITTAETPPIDSMNDTTSILSSPTEPQQKAFFHNAKYQSFLHRLYCLLHEHKNRITPRKILYRICITSLGSPQWYDEHFEEDFLKFLTLLRAAVRSFCSVCFITMPMHLVAKYDENLIPKIRNLVDYAIELDSFAGSDDRATNSAFSDYHGLLRIHKIAAINTLCAYTPETFDLAFKLRLKKFVIEKFHLPPELQDSGNEADGINPEIVPTISCGTNNSNSKANLDF